MDVVTPIALALRLATSLIAFALPGYLLIRLLRLSTDLFESLPIAFGLGILFLTLLNLPLYIFRLAFMSVMVGWALLIVGLLALLIWRDHSLLKAVRFREIVAASAWGARFRQPESYLRIGFLLALAIIAGLLFVGGTWVSGEEEVELIITRKLLQNASVTPSNIIWIDGVTTTYVLVPFYLFRAFLSYAARVDPILIHYRMAFLCTILSLMAFYGITKSLTNSRRMGYLFLALAIAHVFIEPPPQFPTATYVQAAPFPQYYGWTSAFYRGTFSVNVLFALNFLIMLKALEQSAGWSYVGLSVAIFATTLVTQAYGALGGIFLAGVMLFALAVSLALGGDSPETLKRNIKKTAVMLGGYLLVVMILSQVFGSHQARAQYILTPYRDAMLDLLATIARNPLRYLFKLPGSGGEVCSYFNCRSLVLDHFERLFVRQASPLYILGLLASAMFVFFEVNYKSLFVLLTLIVAPVLFRQAAVLVALLALDGQMLNTLPYELAFLQYFVILVIFVLAARFSLHLATRGAGGTRPLITYTLAGMVTLPGAVALFHFGSRSQFYVKTVLLYRFPDWARNFADYHLQRILGVNFPFESIPRKGDMLLLYFCAAVVLLLVVRHCTAVSIPWKFSERLSLPVSVMAAALAVSLFIGMNAGTRDANLIQASIASNDLRDFDSAYLMYAGNYGDDDLVTNLYPISEALFNGLLFVRDNIPTGSVFAADPNIIRTIPVFADQYIVHSGIPFEFYEPYFLEYHEDSPGRHFERRDPFFRDDLAISDDILETDVNFLRKYEVDYLLVTPRYYNYAKAIFDRLGSSQSISFEKLYDDDGVAVYHIERHQRSAPRRDYSPAGDLNWANKTPCDLRRSAP